MNIRIEKGCLFLLFTVIIGIILWGVLTNWKFITKSQPSQSYMIGTYQCLYSEKNLTTDIGRDSKWYNQYKNQTLIYLKSVYPLGSFDKLSAIQLAQIYNSLYYYYNPCTGNSTLTEKPFYNFGLVSNTKWTFDLCKNIALPYPPIGTFFDWYEYAQNNIPFTFSLGDKINNKTRVLSTLISSQPTIPWGMYKCNSQGKFCSEKSKTNRSGPGPMWVTSYSWIRNLHHPFGIYFENNEWKVNNISIEQIDKTYNWNKKENEFIEVSHSDMTPGLVQSQGFWFNSMPYGGTGIFYKIGKTKIANNKVSMLYSLLTELLTKTSDELKLPNLSQLEMNIPKRFKHDYSKLSGSELIKYWYNTTDIYKIIWKYAGGSEKNFDEQTGADYQPNTDNVWGNMTTTLSGTPLLEIVNNWYLLDNGRGVLAASGLINPLGKSVDYTNDIKYSDLNWKNIGKSIEYTINNTCDFATLVKYNTKKDNPTWIDKKLAIDKCMEGDYYLSRVATTVAWDEPMFWCANILGYQTLQLPHDANSSGYLQGEIIHTLIPKKYQDLIKGRIYSNVINDNNNVSYTADYIIEMQNEITQYLSMRDPIDISNESKVQICPLGWKNGKLTNCGKTNVSCSPVYCDKNNNSCFTRGWYDFCTGDDTTIFPDNLSWGTLTSENSCYPVFDNIYCPQSLSAKYNQIMIESGMNNIIYNTKFCEETGGQWQGNSPNKYCSYQTPTFASELQIQKHMDTHINKKFINLAGHK